MHIDSCELHAAEGKVHLVPPIGRVSKPIFVELRPRATNMIGAALLRTAIAVFPYKPHTILTDNGVAQGSFLQPHPHRPRHQAQADQAVPPLDQRTGRAHKSHAQEGDGQISPLQDTRESHHRPANFFVAYHFAGYLEARRWKTPFQIICETWTKDPSTIRISPHRLIPGPYI